MSGRAGIISSTNGQQVTGSVATYTDLPAAADHTGEYYRVKDGSGGVVVAGFRIGGNDPGIYYSDGSTWSIRKDLDALDIKIDASQYNHIDTAANLRDGIKELETAIGKRITIGGYEFTHIKLPTNTGSGVEAGDLAINGWLNATEYGELLKYNSGDATLLASWTILKSFETV